MNNSFTVSFQARVTKDAVNNGLPSLQTKTNNVRLDWTGKTGTDVTASAATSFGEPDLTIIKSMTPSPVDAGDTVTVTLADNQ